ncbi:MAG TPA: hypothetical protein VK631_11705 [Solirubrobacteraceae bacterium]|nr:hypothetical protein [Solirubrobacteraceae bacterium]
MPSFESYAKRFIVCALDLTPSDIASDVYVVSFYVDQGNDPRSLTVEVGFNTEARVAQTTPSLGRGPGSPVASDADEARWNFAFWLQNELGVLGDPEKDPEGAAHAETWLRDLGLWYSDEEEDEDFEAAMEKVEQISVRFTDVLVTTARQLHHDGTIARIFGRQIPVLIHELEYYDEIAEQNRRANPDDLAEDFARWIDDM